MISFTIMSYPRLDEAKEAFCFCFIRLRTKFIYRFESQSDSGTFSSAYRCRRTCEHWHFWTRGGRVRLGFAGINELPGNDRKAHLLCSLRPFVPVNSFEPKKSTVEQFACKWLQPLIGDSCFCWLRQRCCVAPADGEGGCFAQPM